MDIKLKTKDADFILKFIRTDLQKVIDSDKKLTAKYEELEKCYTEDMKGTIIEGLLKITNNFRNAVKEDNEKLKAELERCVELLTCGSEE